MSSDSDETLDSLRLFGYQNLTAENDLLRLEQSGIDLGRAQVLKKEELVDTELFELEIRKRARRMADFYILYYCIENTIRRLISETLTEKHGPNWWDTQVPDNVKHDVEELQRKERESPVTIRSDDPLSYTTFGQLIDIFNKNWADFSDIIRSQKAMQETLSRLNGLRGVIAHSCDLSDDEMLRFKLSIRDWQRIQS
jgi:hypothetical protein